MGGRQNRTNKCRKLAQLAHQVRTSTTLEKDRFHTLDADRKIHDSTAVMRIVICSECFVQLKEQTESNTSTSTRIHQNV